MTDHADTLRELAARMKDRAMTCPRGGLTKEGMTIASVCSDLDKFADELRAIAALEAGRSGEAAGEVVESDNADGSTVLRVCWFGGIPPSGTKLYDHPQQPPPVGVTDEMVSATLDAFDDACLNDEGRRVSWYGHMRPDRERIMRVALEFALSHQQPAPSVSERVWIGVDHASGSDETVEMEWPPKPAPVSEPAASKSRTKRIAIEQGKQDPFVPIPGETGSKLVDAASGEGLPIVAWLAEADGFREVIHADDLYARTESGELPPIAKWTPLGDCAAIEARRLTTTGQSHEDGLEFEPDEQHQVADMANVGFRLMRSIETNFPDYEWSESPTEIVTHLANELHDATTGQSVTDEMVEVARNRYRFVCGLNDECTDDTIAWKEALTVAIASLKAEGEFLEIPPFLRRDATREEHVAWEAKHKTTGQGGVDGQ